MVDLDGTNNVAGVVLGGHVKEGGGSINCVRDHSGDKTFRVANGGGGNTVPLTDGGDNITETSGEKSVSESGGENSVTETGGENSVTETGGENSVSESGGGNSVTETGGVLERTKVLRGRPLRKCSLEDCSFCKIVVNCGLCRSCQTPKLKSKCTQR